jgi:Ca-activated chloride channel homolog
MIAPLYFKLLGSAFILMRPHWISCGLLLLAYCAGARGADPQTNVAVPQGAPYSLSMSVDEVRVNFHAADLHGLAVNDLKLDELSLLDNGKPPGKIVAFGSLREFPIRAGFLMDTSESMEGYLARNRAISVEYAQRLLRQQSDQAFVMDFDAQSRVTQSWTSSTALLTEGLHSFVANGKGHNGSTAIFDAVYRGCLNQFGRLDRTDSANFILLFSDGEDNASQASLKDAIGMCQRTNTAIYIFRAQSQDSFSEGPKTLAELACKSGGHVFYGDGSDAEVYSDLRAIEADLRNQYLLIYKPAELKHDGAFHRIQLKAPARVESIAVRSGYYAPVH